MIAIQDEKEAGVREVDVGGADLEVELMPSLVKVSGNVELDHGGELCGGAITLRDEDNKWGAGGLLRPDGNFTTVTPPGVTECCFRGFTIRAWIRSRQKEHRWRTKRLTCVVQRKCG